MPLLDIFSKKKVKKQKVRIVVDNREKNSLVVSELMSKGFEIEFRQLPVADYLVNGVAIERKTVSDLKSSVVNKRIVQQLLELKQYLQCFLLVEGILDEDLYSSPGLHENAFRGFLLSVALDFNVPVIFTHDAEDTARYIDVLARRKKVEQGIRASKIFRTKKEQMQFILEGFPNVGPLKANALIKRFGSLSGVFNASEEELSEVLGKRTGDFKNLLE